MHRPDYDNSIVNLMASISGALGGGSTGYAPLEALSRYRFADRPVVLLLVDGMGDALLRRFPDSRLQRHRIGTLTSVFPSTTASAITSLHTGVAPQQHAITGWHMWLKELGSVAAILPFAPRHGGAPYSSAGWTPNTLIGAPPLTERLDGPCHQLSPSHIVDSDFSRAGTGRARRSGYSNLEEFFGRLVQLVSDGAPRYLFAYWTELDALAHTYGAASTQVSEHFLTFDRTCAAALDALRGSGALVLITADHGLIDTTPQHTIRLEHHPRLAQTLALPLCGEPRAAYGYLRPGRERQFLDYIDAELPHACEAIPSARLVDEGWFGRGTPHPQLQARIGDYVVVMKENYVLRDRLANERPFSQIGVHGGVSDAEMTVPLAVCEP